MKIGKVLVALVLLAFYCTGCYYWVESMDCDTVAEREINDCAWLEP